MFSVAFIMWLLSVIMWVVTVIHPTARKNQLYWIPIATMLVSNMFVNLGY